MNLSSSFSFGWEPVAGLSKKDVAEDKGFTPMIELMIIDAPDDGKCLSFVNGIVTKDGGIHVEEICKKVFSNIVDSVNESSNKHKRGKNKQPTKETDKNKQFCISISDVKPHVIIILSCRLINPKFSGQTKGRLTAPRPRLEIPEKMVNNI